jgi:hypothetical protein
MKMSASPNASHATAGSPVMPRRRARISQVRRNSITASGITRRMKYANGSVLVTVSTVSNPSTRVVESLVMAQTVVGSSSCSPARERSPDLVAVSDRSRLLSAATQRGR